MTPTYVQPQTIEGFSLHEAQAPTVHEQDQLLIALPECVDFIHAAIEVGGRVLVHSISVSRTTIAICAYCKHFFFSFRLVGCPPPPKKVIECSCASSSSDVDKEDFCRGSGWCLERKYVDCSW